MENETTSADVIEQPVPASQEQSTGDVITEGSAAQVTESVAPSATQTNDVNDVDENGVPFKNRYFEMQRKYEDITRSIPQMIQEGVTAAIKTAVPQQPEYSISDYQAAALKDPDHSPYYQQKIMELQQKEIAKTVESKLSEYQATQQRKQVEAQAFQWANTNFPQIANPSDPLSQMAWQLFNSRPADKREASDFALAVEVAAGRLGVRPAQMRQASAVQEKLVQKEREIKQLVKKTALEGGGRPSSSPDADAGRRADLAAALESGKLASYFTKYAVVAKEE